MLANVPVLGNDVAAEAGVEAVCKDLFGSSAVSQQ
jgi:hypothetical protein